MPARKGSNDEYWAQRHDQAVILLVFELMYNFGHKYRCIVEMIQGSRSAESANNCGVKRLSTDLLVSPRNPSQRLDAAELTFPSSLSPSSTTAVSLSERNNGLLGNHQWTHRKRTGLKAIRAVCLCNTLHIATRCSFATSHESAQHPPHGLRAHSNLLHSLSILRLILSSLSCGSQAMQARIVFALEGDPATRQCPRHTMP